MNTHQKQTKNLAIEKQCQHVRTCAHMNTHQKQTKNLAIEKQCQHVRTCAHMHAGMHARTHMHNCGVKMPEEFAEM